MVAYASRPQDTTSPTATTTSSIYVVVTTSNSNITTATSDPWQTVPTAYTNVTYLPVRSQPAADWAESLRAVRRAASMVPPPRENRAQERRHLKNRKGFQQMARIPCYRGTRYR